MHFLVMNTYCEFENDRGNNNFPVFFKTKKNKILIEKKLNFNIKLYLSSNFII